MGRGILLLLLIIVQYDPSFSSRRMIYLLRMAKKFRNDWGKFPKKMKQYHVCYPPYGTKNQSSSIQCCNECLKAKGVSISGKNFGRTNTHKKRERENRSKNICTIHVNLVTLDAARLQATSYLCPFLAILLLSIEYR